MWLVALLCVQTGVQTAGAATLADLRAARDRQDRPGLEKIITDFSAAAERNAKDAGAQYDLAIANSYLAEISLEMRQRNEARSAAEAGIRAAEKAVALKPEVAEYHRILGTLCGQVIPANVMAGLRYGRCALDSVNKAVQLDPKSSDAYLSRGVGYYYLPAAFGGGVDLAIKDMEKAIELNPKSADAWMWLGVAQRKKNQFAGARKSLMKSLELNANRVWTKQLLEKTPK
ncbi:MAG: tetratricopeptide repeat protein [Bryobacterales bacterium]|nr:tetratricopeptide repeat protein [Bryobacterales bacterium]